MNIPQDEYCHDCAHVGGCNVMLKDGEECGDRYEHPPAELVKFQVRNAERNAQSMIEVDSRQTDEEAADFDAQVLECLNHWPGITPVDLDQDPPPTPGGGFTFETMGGLVKGRCIR